MGSCSYTFDAGTVADGPVPAEDVGDEWACPHEAHPDGERCVFHLGADRRADLGVDDDTVTERFVELFAASEPGAMRVLGADLPTVHLEYRRLGGETRHRVDLRYSDVDGIELDHTNVANPLDLRGARLGHVDCTEAEFEKGLFLDGATVDRALLAPDAEFDEEVHATGLTVVGRTTLEGARFDDDLTFDDAVFEGPVTVAGATLYGRSNERDENTSFEGARFADAATFDQATFEFVSFAGATFADAASFEAAAFTGGTRFDECTFEALADLDGTRFQDNATFVRTTFEGVADFRGVEFEGASDIRHDDADFEGARFHDRARFGDATFSQADFEGATFDADAVFEETPFERDVTFAGVTFGALADFDEGRFREDTSFVDAIFRETADFRGVEFEGGANVLQDDADFEGATFDGPARFDAAEFAFADFDDVTFAGEARFEDARFDEDVHFVGATFERLADFDEARFEADGDFGHVTFGARADFRGVAFHGEARHLEDNARFEGASFEGPAEFDDAVFNALNFRDVSLAATVDFRRVVVRDRVDALATSAGTHVYVNMTDADIGGGEIRQPPDHEVRYDFTRARIGDVTIRREGAEGVGTELFDFFRFLETDFDGFDFSAHRDALERNDWLLHVFDEGSAGYEFDMAATASTIETTYLYAYNNAKSMGDNDAAIEFAIHQARFRRRKNVDYVRDDSLSPRYRLGKLGDVIGNSLWYLSCGYGYRLWRILATSIFVIVTWAVLYALPFTELDNTASLGSIGELFSPDGAVAVGQYLYYSLITFTTVGYGDINPVNAAARTLAAAEGILGILLAALVVFVLGRRVAV